MKTKTPNREIGIVLTIVLWLVTAWLLYPLVNLDNVDMSNVKEYLYRSALGLTIMIIFFGKTLFDLIYPWVTSRKLPLINIVFLTIYGIALSGGIILLIIRIAVLYMKTRQKGLIF